MIAGAFPSESDTQVNIDLLPEGAVPELPLEEALRPDKPAPATEPMQAAPVRPSASVEPTAVPAQTSGPAEAAFSEEEVELLARIVSAEAKGEPYAGQIAVAAVVLNRVEKGFGESIEDVIFAEGQFQPVDNGAIHKQPVDSAYDAAEEAMNGYDPTKGAVYFANMDIADNHPNPKAKRTVKIGDHTFFR